MPALAGALTRLGLLALPAIPSPSYLAAKAVSDTWSLSFTDSGVTSVNAGGTDTWSLAFTDGGAISVATQAAGTDTWSISFADSSALTTYPKEKTQLSLLALPGKYVAVTAKASAASQSIDVSDNWFLTWTEDPTNQLIIDTWDTWALRWTESIGLAVSQTFAPTDIWALSWTDIGSVFAGGPVTQDRNDTWSLSFADASAIAVATTASDTWSVTFTDSGGVSVSQDAIAGTDTWSLAFTLDTGFTGVVSDIPIIASDEWDLTFIEVTGIVSLSIDVPSGRRIRVSGPTRTTKV